MTTIGDKFVDDLTSRVGSNVDFVFGERLDEIGRVASADRHRFSWVPLLS